MGYWKRSDDRRADMLERRAEIGSALTAARSHRLAGRVAHGEAEYEMARVQARAYLQLGGKLPTEWLEEIEEYAERAQAEGEMMAELMARGLTYIEASERVEDEVGEVTA